MHPVCLQGAWASRPRHSWRRLPGQSRTGGLNGRTRSRSICHCLFPCFSFLFCLPSSSAMSLIFLEKGRSFPDTWPAGTWRSARAGRRLRSLGSSQLILSSDAEDLLLPDESDFQGKGGRWGCAMGLSCVAPNSYVEVLTSSVSERGCFWFPI